MLKSARHIIFLSAFLTIILLSVLACQSPEQSNPDNFAACLTEKGAEMYGAYWCSHCQAQKEMFGNSFLKINYVECTLYQDKCSQAGIRGYPTWKFKDGSTLQGVQEFSKLAERTGCIY